MKQGIHPKYFSKSLIICACGNKVETGATQEKIELEICNKCHPLFSDKEKLLDTGGQIEKFKQRVKKAAAKKSQIKSDRGHKSRRAGKV